MGRYAKNTSVSVEKSKAEIEQIAMRYGATSYRSGWVDEGGLSAAQVEFYIDKRHIRITLPLPSKDDEEFTLTETGRERHPDNVYKAWEQGCRELWRSFKMMIHAKLEAIEIGASTLDKEFMADIVMPDGKTIGQHVIPRIEDAYAGGSMKRLLPAQFKD